MRWDPFGPKVRTWGLWDCCFSWCLSALTVVQARVGDAAWVKKLNQPLPLMSQSCDDGHLEAGSGGWWAPWALVV